MVFRTRLFRSPIQYGQTPGFGHRTYSRLTCFQPEQEQGAVLTGSSRAGTGALGLLVLVLLVLDEHLSSQGTRPDSLYGSTLQTRVILINFKLFSGECFENLIWTSFCRLMMFRFFSNLWDKHLKRLLLFQPPIPPPRFFFARTAHPVRCGSPPETVRNT